mgnify:CR=1 FL=1
MPKVRYLICILFCVIYIDMKRVIILCFCFALFASSVWAKQDAKSVNGAKVSREVVRKQYQEFYNGAVTFYKGVLEGDERRLQRAMAAAEPYIDFFSNQDYSQIPSWEKGLIEKGKRGQYEDAIVAYDSLNLAGSYNIGSDSYNSIERFALLLQLPGVRDRALVGVELLRDVTMAEEQSKSLRPMSRMINLALDLRLYTLAEDFFYKFRERANDDPDKVAEVLGFRTMMLCRRNRPNEALAFGRRSILMYDSICHARKNADYEALSRARIHLAMARVYDKMQEKEYCIQQIRSCRDCFEAEARVNGDNNLIERMRALNTLAPMAADQNAFFLADSIFTELDGLGSWLYDNDKFQKAQYKFNSLRFRGLTCYRVGKNQESRRYFEEASAVLDEMERLSPGQNLEHHQNLNFNIASLYYQEKNYEKALELDRKVLSLVLEDKIHDERRHNNDLSYCYKYIGNCLWAKAYQTYLNSKKRKTKEVMALYKEAYDHYATALHYNSRDAESQARYNLVDYILSGMEKPMGIPSNF